MFKGGKAEFWFVLTAENLMWYKDDEVNLSVLNSAVKKGKERKSIYIAPLYIVSKRLGMDHTVLPANYTMPAFPS